MSYAPWAIGSDIAGYRLLHDFGQDACGEIFLAADPAGNQVTIRTLFPQLAADRSKLMDFYHQAKLGMAVDHPHVQKVLRVEQASGRHFVVSEFWGLHNLKYQLKDRSRLEEAEAVRLVYQLAQILEDLHEDRDQPIVHRAVSPANVLI
ncbi:MAG: protein kinase, partial [Planctomycetaceae bacterium]|nr:protein kinase [Planctomycetaceae bacterium]